MAAHNLLGEQGEAAAADYLRKSGYLIMQRNWRWHHYELDIIAKIDSMIVFVEVKTRHSDQWGDPEDAINKGKIKRIVESAHYYLIEKEIDLPARFDIISAIWDGKKFHINHIEDAFLAPLQ